METNRVGRPFPRFASRGVHNICLGPRATNPELRGERVVVAIFDKRDWVVRELREQTVEASVETAASATGEPRPQRYQLVDVDLDGNITVLHEDSKAVIGDKAKWVKTLDTWSARYGVKQ